MRIQEGAVTQGGAINSGSSVARDPVWPNAARGDRATVTLPQGKQTEKIEKTDAKADADKEVMQAAADLLNKSLPKHPPSLHFVLREEVEMLQLEVWDVVNQKVIKKIPSDEVVKLVEKIRDMVGLFLDEKV